MKPLTRGFAAFTLAALTQAPVATAQDAPPAMPDGVTVQPRGPVHEAFARPADVSARTPVIPKQPPEPIKELPPDQKPEGDNVQWVPGYWGWDDEAKDFLWVSGCWRVPPPGRQWVAGSWAQVNGGWQWQHGFWAGTDADAPKQLDVPAPPSIETGPSTPAPDDDSYYVPGRWVFQDDSESWAWQPGYWAKNPGNMVYQPPAYLPNDGGTLCVPGYWDYPLQDRGQLFAPVAISGSPWAGNPGWAYTPSYGVGLGGLFGSLFVRPNTGSYYFGNYFGNPYRGLGYQPWSAYAGRGYDPLLNYYRWSNRGTAGWSGGLNNLYAGRLNGSLPAPATNLRAVAPAAVSPAVVSQHTVHFNRNLSVNPVNSLQTVHHISQLNGNPVRLTPATQSQLATQPRFQTRQSFSRPLPTPAASITRPPVTLPNRMYHGGFPSAVAPTFRSTPVPTPAPAYRSVAPAMTPRIQSAPAHHAAQTFRAAPAMHAAPTFHAAPAFHHAAPAMPSRMGGGHVGGGHVGGGHMGGAHVGGGHGGGHHR